MTRWLIAAAVVIVPPAVVAVILARAAVAGDCPDTGPDDVACINCGHLSHWGEWCDGRSDAGAYPCACSWPDPGNFTDDEVTW